MAKYNIHQFLAQFPDNDACLDYIFKRRFPHVKAKRIKGRKSYFTPKGRQIYPLAGTIFEGSSTPLTKWFYAIFVFSHAKNGIAAKELQRQISVTYKCAWRMCKQIRALMKQERGQILSGVVEADETYIGGTRRLGAWKKPKIAVVGLLERKGKVVAKALSRRSEYEIAPFVEKHLKKGSTLYTDSAPVYNTLRGYNHAKVVHTDREYVRGEVHTNNIEGFWGHFKRSVRGTHTYVSRKHIQGYIDAAVFRWNNREDVFAALMERI
jgi:transposase